MKGLEHFLPLIGIAVFGWFVVRHLEMLSDEILEAHKDLEAIKDRLRKLENPNPDPPKEDP